MRNLVPRVWKLRQRFGIAAPRVTIQSQIPWYWRWIGIAVLLGISAASAAWIYDAGRRLAGLNGAKGREGWGARGVRPEAAAPSWAAFRPFPKPADTRWPSGPPA